MEMYLLFTMFVVAVQNTRAKATEHHVPPSPCPPIDEEGYISFRSVFDEKSQGSQSTHTTESCESVSTPSDYQFKETKGQYKTLHLIGCIHSD